jgi:hypothetical protein
MENEELLEAIKIYQSKHGGSLVEISILFVNVTAALHEAAQQSVEIELPTQFPEGHGDLVIENDLRFCPVCKFAISS